MKRIVFLMLFLPVLTFAESLYSPTWGFKVNLPEGYEYTDGDGKDQFSFTGPGGAMFDMVVYNGAFSSIKEMAGSVTKKLGNKGSVDYFKYKDKQAAIIELNFGSSSGWGLCVELPAGASAGKKGTMLLALAYGPADNRDLHLFHFSALDSIIPSAGEQYYPGPVTEYSYPRGKRKQVKLGSSGITAAIFENDAAAAQTLIEREFSILTTYLNSPNQKEAWIRYYRAIFRDSVDRVSDAVTALGKKWGADTLNGSSGLTAPAERAFAGKALAFVQGFKYERNFKGADFVNLVSAVTEGRGDCDSRAMLWAIILANADIPAAMMVSPQYSHAMGLADIDGTGARFELSGAKWLVAETTANVEIGLIAEDVSDPQYWIGILFE